MQYAYTTGTLGTVQQIVSYAYGDADWKDKLTRYNGVDIAYDAIGNPIQDGVWTYTWENGRQLRRMACDATIAEFVYNADGLRVQKTVNGVTTNYTLHGKNIVHMTKGNAELHFWYDAQNRPAIVEFNGTKYGYLYNLQGDVIGLIDSANTEVVKYTYDAWGKPLSVTGSLANTIGYYNPFRYRGYVYDVETGLYYLRSRYYNPSWGRFVNSDKMLGKFSQFFTHNVYIYCDDNPVNMLDRHGTDAIWIQESNSAAGFGHSGMMVQDSNDDWYYFFWGPVAESFSKEVISGTELKCVVEKVYTNGNDLSNTETVIDVLMNMGADAPAASERANKITDTYYFEGDYTNSYKMICNYQTQNDSYRLFSNNCVQKTLRAFEASDERFIWATYGKTNNLIPNHASAKVSLMPRKKCSFPWKLWLFNLLE